jgi:hypothetical protein
MDPREITEELGHPGMQDLLDSATLLRLANFGAGRIPAFLTKLASDAS